jgi:Tfp pilus assembly protein PilF
MESKQKENSFFNPLISLGLLIFIMLCAYINSFRGNFVFDDVRDIVLNPIVQNPPSLFSIIRYFPSRWLGYASFCLNIILAGNNPLGFHIVNFALHVINTILVWYFIRLLTRTPWCRSRGLERIAGQLALMTAALFAVHPLQTQAVSYIVQRFTLLASFFYLAGLCFYLQARFANAHPSVAKRYYIFCASAFLGGMFSKEIIYTFPIVIGVVELYFFESFSNNTFIRKRWKAIVLTLCIAITAGVFIIEPHDFFRRFAVGDRPTHTQLQYFITQFWVLLTYIRLMLFPIGQNADYDLAVLTSFFDPRALLGIGVYVSLWCGAVIAFVKEKRFISFAVVLFLVLLLVESSCIPLREIIAEHRLYLPILGFSLLVSMILVRIIKNKKILSVIFILIISVFVVLTYQRNLVWQDQLTFWTDVIKKSPNKARAYVNRGTIYSQHGKFKEAFDDFTVAIENDPEHAAAHFNIAKIYFIFNQPEKALEHFERAQEKAREKTLLKMIYYYRALIFAALDKQQQALDEFSHAIEVDPTAGDIYFQRAFAFFALEKPEEALKDLATAERLGYTLSAEDQERKRLYVVD